MIPNGQPPQVVGKIEIVLFSNGQMGFNMQGLSRFHFNGMMETAKQMGLVEILKSEQHKVVLPEPDVSRLQL